MLSHIAQKVREAELFLDFKLPKKLFDILRKLDSEEYPFGQEIWRFPIFKNDETNSSDNFIIENSEYFFKQWDLEGFVFATNGIDNFLLLLKNTEGNIMKEVFILNNETDEIKIFNYSLEKLIKNGPLDYNDWNEYYLKLREGRLFEGGEKADPNEEN